MKKILAACIKQIIQFDSEAEFEAIDGKLEYSLKYGETKKGFNTFDIEEVYEAE